MPLWRIYSHPDTFTLDQKRGIAAAITKHYDVLPAFYVDVIFVDCKEGNVWVGPESKTNFVRIVVEQIARAMPSPDTAEGRAWRTGWMDKINEVCGWHTLCHAEHSKFIRRLFVHTYSTERSLTGRCISQRLRGTCGVFKASIPRQRILRQKSLGRQRITHIPTKLSILSEMIALSIETIEEPISYMITTILRSSSNIAPSENL